MKSEKVPIKKKASAAVVVFLVWFSYVDLVFGNFSKNTAFAFRVADTVMVMGGIVVGIWSIILVLSFFGENYWQAIIILGVSAISSITLGNPLAISGDVGTLVCLVLFLSMGWLLLRYR